MEMINTNIEELKQNSIDIYVILQQIKADPSKLDYYLSVYEGKLSSLGVSLETYQLKK